MVEQGERLILVVDDNQFNREGLSLYLRIAGYATSEAADLQSALAAAQLGRPAGAVIDIVIPTHEGAPSEMDESVGLDLVRQLKQRNPSLGIVVFSAYDDRGREVWQLVRDGMRGLAYLLKGSRPERVLDSLEQALAGNVVLDPNALTNTRRLEEEFVRQMRPEERHWIEQAAALISTLTEREMEVAQRLADSQNLQGIADSLGINQRTVENHITSVYNKLKLSSVDQETPALRKSTLLAKAAMLYVLTTAENRPA